MKKEGKCGGWEQKKKGKKTQGKIERKRGK